MAKKKDKNEVTLIVTKATDGSLNMRVIGDATPFDVLTMTEFAAMRTKFIIMGEFRAPTKPETEAES